MESNWKRTGSPQDNELDSAGCDDEPAHSWRSPEIVQHSYATHLIEAGVDLLEVQKILGHYSILTTARYTHLTSHTNDQAEARINALMNRFSIQWGVVK